MCFDLSDELQGQINQIKYWLDYLNSFFCINSETSQKSKWRVILVGTRADLSLQANSQPLVAANPILQWQQTWASLPLHHEIIFTSQTSTSSIDYLLDVVKLTCKEIMSKFATQVPTGFVSILKVLQLHTQSGRPFIRVDKLDQLIPNNQHLQVGLQYLHAVGDIVMLPNGLICTDPSYVSQLMSNFISPESVQVTLPHIMSGKVEILTSDQVGKVLLMTKDDQEYVHEVVFPVSNHTCSIYEDLQVMSEFGICVPLHVLENRRPSFLFPSLAKESTGISLSVLQS